MNTVRSFLFVAILGLLLVTQFNSASASPSGVAIRCAGIEELVEFVSEETGYPPLRSCPNVSVAPDFVLRSLFAKASTHGEEPMAAFIPASAEILLSPNVDITKLLGRSYLVHELVHASQLENGVKAPAKCLSLPESEAYWAQATYLRKFGLDEDALAFELVSMVQSACAHPYNR